MFCNIIKQRFSLAKNFKFGVVGGGQMGTGIAIVANKFAKVPVTIVDAYEPALDKSKKFIDSWCTKEIGKNRMTEEEKNEII